MILLSIDGDPLGVLQFLVLFPAVTQACRRFDGHSLSF